MAKAPEQAAIHKTVSTNKLKKGQLLYRMQRKAGKKSTASHPLSLSPRNDKNSISPLSGDIVESVWKSGDDAVRNFVDVTIPERSSDVKLFGRNLEKLFYWTSEITLTMKSSSII